jgi:hypothetical protein
MRVEQKEKADNLSLFPCTLNQVDKNRCEQIVAAKLKLVGNKWENFIMLRK